MTLPSTVWCVRERAALALGHSGTAIGVQPLGTKLRLVTARQRLTVCPLGTTRDQGPRVCQQAVVALDVDEVRGHAEPKDSRRAAPANCSVSCGQRLY